MTISVCTLAFDRDEHLANLVRGLNRSERPPCELVVAVLQSQRYDLPATSFPVRQVMVGETQINLARARNTAARSASGSLLVFLDVDCIPAPSLIEDYAAASAAHSGAFMGDVAYLPKDATMGAFDYARFEALCVRHADRVPLPQSDCEPCDEYGAFWSLNFAIPAHLFDAIGGFDERYVGYGGEDTDFARTLGALGVPLWTMARAKAYHQYHPHHMPPVHHLDSVLANARTYLEKWGEPVMEHWLRAFQLMGLIAPCSSKGWTKVREPRQEDFALTRQQAHMPYARSSLVLEALEAQASRGRADNRAPAITLA